MIVSGSLGERIVALRTEKKESQQELASALQIDQSAISRWEKSIRYPDTDTIKMIAKHFDVDPSVLLSAPMVAPTKANKPVILCVEDVPALLDETLYVLRNVLPETQIVGFRTAAEALPFARETRVDVAFLDIELIGESGIKLAQGLLELNSRANLVFLTCHPEYAGEAFSLFASGYALKPLTEKKAREQLAHLRYPVSGLSS